MSNAVDPYQLLKALGPLLTTDGAMKNETQVPRIAGLMTGARKLVSRCIYVNILRATDDQQLLNRFVSGGGWELLNTWLQGAKETDNIPFITDLLNVLKKLPVTIDILKKNNTAKLIKQMSKTEVDETLKSLAGSVVSEWMKVIKQTHENADVKPASASAAAIIKKKKKKLAKRPPPKGDAQVDDVDEDNMDNGNSKPEQGGSPRPEDHHERTKRVNGSRADQETKRRLSAQEKSPRGERPSKVSRKQEEAIKMEEEKPRIATIKRPAHTRLRSTGLEMANTLPPIKIKKKKPTEQLPSINKGDRAAPVKREGPIFGKSLLPPEKKPKLETPTSSASKASPSSSPSNTSALPTTSSSSNGQGKIKLIPAKPKLLHESSNFMDALNAPAIPIRKVKTKKPAKPASPTTNKPTVQPLDTSGSHSSAKEGEQEGKVDSPQEVKPDPPKFRFYSSGQTDEEGSAEKAEDGQDTVAAEGAVQKTMIAGTGNLKLIPSKSKKCVQWKDEDSLVDTFYFEMDETERENVNRPKDFRNAAHLDLVMEREAMKNAKMQGDGTVPLPTNNDLEPWKKPALMEVLDIPPVDYGCNSVEKGLQKQREMVVLQEIYFDKNMIPDTPKEVDPEPFEPKEPTRIPLEDETKRRADDNETAESSEGSTPLYSEPMPPVHPAAAGPLGPHPLHPAAAGIPQLPPGLQLENLQLDNLPPAIASLVQQMPRPGQPPPPSMPGAGPQLPLAPPGPGGRPNDLPPGNNATISNVQNLLNSIMGNQQGGPQASQEELTNKLRDMLEPFKNQLPGNAAQGSLAPPQPPNHPGPPNFNPEGWGPRGPPGGPGPGGPGPGGPGPGGPGPGGPGPGGPGPGGPGPVGPMRGRGGMGPPFGGPGRGGFNPRYNGPQFPNGPARFPGPGGPDMGPRGPPRPPMRGAPWPRGGRGRGGNGFASRPVCRHFMTPRGCERAQTCQFYHPGVNGPPLTQ